MAWTVLYHDAFLPEMELLSESVQDGLLTMVELLTMSGPMLGRPHADTLTGSKHANMKELRFTADDGVWRWRSRSIRSAAPSSWSQATRAGWRSSASTKG
jgi:hypothetical protein